MSDGTRNIVINKNERALSTDINRLQSFAGADLCELMRAMLDTDLGVDDITSGNTLQVTTSNSPVNAEVLNGLTVRPQNGVLDLQVDPGFVFLFDPDSPPNPDESQYKLLNDPGIPTNGVLQMTANASGSTRIDVIECARVASPGYSVLETDNRDTFDPISGSFTAITVNKVIAGRLQYRVRAGSPGAGFPGTATGWLPLAVASVPTGTSTNDTITFWDVRPLVSDRIRHPHNTGEDLPKQERLHALVDVVTHSGKAVLTGMVETTGGDRTPSTPIPGKRRLGGRFRRGTPGTDNVLGIDGVDLLDAANQDGSSFGSSGFFYVYMLEPFGLPRWSRYSDASVGARAPRNPRGILVVSSVAPIHYFGNPVGGVSLPASTGLGGSSASGMCVFAGNLTFGGMLGLIADGRVVYPTPVLAPSPVITGAPDATWTLTDGTTHPAHAKALWVSFLFSYATITPDTDTAFDISVSIEDGSGNVFAKLNEHTAGGSPRIHQVSTLNFASMSMRVPIASFYPSSGIMRKLKAVVNSTNVISITTASMSVDGYEV